MSDSSKQTNSPKITMYGASWCGDCHRVKMYFEQNEIEYNYIDIDADAKASQHVIDVNPEGNRSIPVVETTDGETFIEPTWAELDKYFNSEK